MGNLDVKIDGDKLVITVLDVTAAGRPSSTGKTRIIASTQGPLLVDHPKVAGLKLSLNVMVPAPAARKGMPE